MQFGNRNKIMYVLLGMCLKREKKKRRIYKINFKQITNHFLNILSSIVSAFFEYFERVLNKLNNTKIRENASLFVFPYFERNSKYFLDNPICLLCLLSFLLFIIVSLFKNLILTIAL